MSAGPQGPDSYPSPPPGYPQPAPQSGGPQYPLAAPEPPLGSIGDITITRTQVITPAGMLPLRGSIWTAMDMSRTEEYMPAYAVVLAIVFFLFCLLGLLFLLLKASRTTGFVQVTVNSGGRYHATMVPVSSPQHVYDLMQYVNWARSMAALA